MKQRLQHSRLDQAIHNNQSLTELLAMPCEWLGNYCVRDYIGSPALKKDHSTDNTFAKGFFEDQGAWRETRSLDAGEGLSLAIFATFLAVEIDAGTDQAEFVVLAPKRSPDKESGMYVGLMRSHNTDGLRQLLGDDPGVLEQIVKEVVALVDWLRVSSEEQSSVSGSWFGRLFNSFESKEQR